MVPFRRVETTARTQRAIAAGRIATALDPRTIRFARDVGARWLRTNNEESNPMHQNNRRPGHAPLPAGHSNEEELVTYQPDTTPVAHRVSRTDTRSERW